MRRQDWTNNSESPEEIRRNTGIPSDWINKPSKRRLSVLMN
jgi:hypothetical protein